MIYIYRMWDFYNGYWAPDSSERKERIDDSDDWYWMDVENYRAALQRKNQDLKRVKS